MVRKYKVLSKGCQKCQIIIFQCLFLCGSIKNVHLRSTWHVKSVQDRVQLWGSDTENIRQGSKHFRKWVNIWQPSRMSLEICRFSGIFLEPLWNVLKWNRKLGSLCPWRPPYFPLWAKKDMDGDKTVCQQFGFCQREVSIALTLFNVTDI